ncbi:sporulation integral membrane protein YlbJ [Paenibacillus baekrokdamisoli]|uniref:Sporulation integral membrane protein YlbJ n=1 Tax=Paenibacillus baekrokdamisoli TaxID=1712516 RepID=A0A3G9IPX2_9BACL|nr:nucleoside recognition domain-containing protein [Paenibacillus baekrokdamisoli]MBB3069729.1 sporulation integral membrane protein YlbJ [Paenibacillus baekrokdamisoli]BBH20917.1 sporulation integral membrane protein YlbJ [Paenibacillus baekrokdamisoli]
MIRTVLLACLSILLVATIIVRPDDAFQASLQGLTIWWNIVFPGLLPFLTLLELMLAFGAVHALGALLDPLMRRLFRLPGEAGLAIALGWTSGFPSGAESTAILRRGERVTQAQGQRLLTLAHMPSPLFMLLVVGAGFSQRPELGVIIAAAVWMAAIITGLAHARFSKTTSASPSNTSSEAPGEKRSIRDLLRLAAKAMTQAKIRDGRTFGKALGDSVITSVYKLMAIGGFMMICSVLVRLLAPIIPDTIPSFVLPGLIESHIGAYAASAVSFPGGLAWNAAVIAAILSWGGVSALLQAGSAITGTDLSIRPLAVMRLLQAAVAFTCTILLWRPISNLTAYILPSSTPAFQLHGYTVSSPPPAIHVSDLHSLWPYTPVLFAAFGCVLLLLTLASISSSLRFMR